MSWVITPSFTQWTPALISTALWLDAADASTITESGGAVSQWNDKSGNGRNARQATAGNRPTYTSAVLNGKNVVSFNGSTQWFATISAYGAGHFAAVAKSTISKSFAGLHTGTTSELILSGTGTQVIQASTSYVNSSTNLSIAFNQPFIWGVNLSATRSAGRTLGEEPNGSGAARAWNGYCGELIVLASPQDGEIRNRLEGYLAHKWGLTANLPSDHPYKVNPPAP
jgi:hypothetical protein